MNVEVHVTDLGLLLGSWTVNVIGTEIRKITALQCATGDPSRPHGRTVRATEADRDRWCSATDEFLKQIRALQERERVASQHLWPPFQGRLWWRLRYALRNWSLRRSYNDTAAQLRSDFDTALATYQEHAGDLPDYVVEFTERESVRRAEEDRRDKARRAAVLTTATGPVWAYELVVSPARRSFAIWLPSLDGGQATHTGMTANQVQAALEAERSEHPYTTVYWDMQTRRALEEGHGSDVLGWRSFTGVLIDSHPYDPSKRTMPSKYHSGPSSDYGSGGFGGGI
ncbi:hypothetical protein [Allokutzneria oryzae]|uniref:Uncharacterized protein n=1 Tax=Allokutzneria oryzae TaxID=1378989 RepID=A0ABV6A1H6_9PSEU